MTIDNTANTSPDSGTQPEESGDEKRPSFMIAIDQYEDFLIAKARERRGDTDPELQGYRSFIDIMSACGPLAGAALNYYFASTSPDLKGTTSETEAAQRLAVLIASPDIPAEVRDIYGSIYSEDLRQYLSPDDT